MLWAKKFRVMTVLVCGLVLCGCNPPGQGAADEEKEPQFLIGRSRVNAMNFVGAIEAFELALEKNPQSAAAHFELGWLNAEKESDPAAAIYHYQKYLKLRPSASNAETIKDHIFRLKQDLAKGVLPVPASNELQNQLEQVTEENRRLNEELDRLKARAVTALPPVNRLSPHPQVARTNPPVQLVQSRATSQSPAAVAPRQVASSNTPHRQHRILAGDTPSSIARRYNVRLESLLAANPALNPRRLRVGENLVIPAR
jgi:LysM repeat protein